MSERFANKPVIPSQIPARRRIAPQELLAALHWRYAVKRFDPAKKVSPEDWAVLEESMRWTPSSFGFQPWKFWVISSSSSSSSSSDSQDSNLRAQLRKHSWDQSQVTDCSHFVVLAALKRPSIADVDRYIARIAQERSSSVESLNGFREVMIEELVATSEQDPKIAERAIWTAKQCYLAMDQLLVAAALMGIDTCPMEGIEPLEFDRILGISDSPYRALCAVAVGYRHPDDKYQHQPKVRYSAEDVFHRI